MSGEKAIQTILCIPGRNYPRPEKQIIAKVTDGDQTRFITFGPYCSRRHIMDRIPSLWMDFRFEDKRKKRGKSA
jgi:hypothetical protein